MNQFAAPPNRYCSLQWRPLIKNMMEKGEEVIDNSKVVYFAFHFREKFFLTSSGEKKVSQVQWAWLFIWLTALVTTRCLRCFLIRKGNTRFVPLAIALTTLGVPLDMIIICLSWPGFLRHEVIPKYVFETTKIRRLKFDDYASKENIDCQSLNRQ